jgi:hypothetical protein
MLNFVFLVVLKVIYAAFPLHYYAQFCVFCSSEGRYAECRGAYE